MVTFACVFRPATPYTTCAPARSSLRAQEMLRCSSKRALSSIRATTCLPFSAAVRSAASRRGSSPVRYSVCLIASTCGSRLASSRKSRMFVNPSYGWCSSTSPSRSVSKMPLSSSPSRSGTAGANSGKLRSGRFTGRPIRSAEPSGPSSRKMSSGASRSRSCRKAVMPGGVSRMTSSRTADPKRRRRRPSSMVASRSSASSSSNS